MNKNRKEKKEKGREGWNFSRGIPVSPRREEQKNFLATIQFSKEKKKKKKKEGKEDESEKSGSPVKRGRGRPKKPENEKASFPFFIFWISKEMTRK